MLGYVVNFENTNFGLTVKVRNHGTSLLMIRDRYGFNVPEGFTRPKLSHQFYVRQIASMIQDYWNKGLREVVIVDLNSGEWQTIWATHPNEVSYP